MHGKPAARFAAGLLACGWLCLASAGLFGCSDSKGHHSTSSPPSLDTAACEQDEDCRSGQTCVDAECRTSVCEAESQACSPDGTAILVCNDAGDEVALRPCGRGQRCTTTRGSATCSRLACEPDAWSCDESSRYREHCRDDGSEIDDRIDCAATSEVCRDGGCVAAGCDSDGSACPAEPCEPGSAACDGDVVVECQDDGKGFTTALDCSSIGEACFEGGCLPRVCTAEFECSKGASFACVDNGTRLQLDRACGANTRTYCSPATGHCLEFVCEPGSAVCQGNTATRCNDEGSGPVAGGVACDMPGKACWDGGCLPKLCTSSFVCDGPELLRCERNSTALTHERIREAGTECNAELGTCSPLACEPNHPECRGTVATSCNANGLGYFEGGENCAAQGQACSGGACVPQTCEPGAAFCHEDEVRLCDSGGASFSVIDSCEATESCRADLKGCVAKICEPGAPACIGNLLTSCRQDGTGLEQAGLDCEVAEQVCDHAACQPKVCTPTLSFCQNDNVYLCNASGSAAAPFAVCDAETPCQGTTGAAHCGAP